MTEHRIRLRAIGPGTDNEKKWESDHVLRIGRLESLEVILEDTSISRRHAEIAITERGWLVRDLGSTNGTFLNGVRVGRTGQPLSARDLLQFGNVVLTVEFVSDEAFDICDAQSGTIQIQAVTSQSLEEAAQKLAIDVTRATKPGEQLLSLLRAGQFHDWTDSIDELLTRNLQATVTSLGATRGAVVLIDTKTGKLILRAVYPSKSDSGPERFYSQTLARRCLRTGQSHLCTSIINDPDLLQADSVTGSLMGSIICALLRSPRRYLGVLHLDRGTNAEPFTRDDLCRADAVATNMSYAFESAQQLQERQHALYIQTVIAFSQVIELRDPYTAGHAQRVTDYALLLAEEMDLSETDHNHLRIGAPLHDIGKIGIDDAVLRKNERLTPEEFEHMKSHTVKGAALIETLPGLEAVLPIVRNHHERWDGAGYPDRLAGENIPLLARLMAVVDTFDAMTTDRPYRDGMSIDQALAQIESCAGSQFDRECAQAFLGMRKTLEQHVNQKDAMAQTCSSADWLARGRPLVSANVHEKKDEPRCEAELALATRGVLVETE
jgi:HD-GYP domain-containing protein (c-di-GMP phosphodiesterase class II)/pSer/pThr/pTyr-binding forkhead associated (FHA) protein